MSWYLIGLMNGICVGGLIVFHFYRKLLKKANQMLDELILEKAREVGIEANSFQELKEKLIKKGLWNKKEVKQK